MLQKLCRFFCYKSTLLHDSIECLVAALEAKDLYTKGHSTRVGDMSYDLAKAIGLTGYKLDEIHIAAHLHDIGKIGIPEQILNKKSNLLPHEWAQIQRHPEIGYNILSKSKHLRSIAVMVLHHHERWDGKGYPYGLKELQIPLGARIIAICDSIDAMTSHRPYRSPLSLEKTFQEIEINKGIQFDPVLAETALDYWPSIVKHLHSNIPA